VARQRFPELLQCCSAAVSIPCGPVGAIRWSILRRTRSPAGSANGFAGFGPGCATLIAGDEVGPLRRSTAPIVDPMASIND